jgi:uncharacterized membrane protein
MTETRHEPLTTAHLVNLLAVLIFSINYVVGRGVYEDAPPFMLGFTRWAGAAVLLAPFAIREVRAEWPKLIENWRMITVCALLMPFIGAGLAYTALTMTVAINVAVVQTALPVFTVLLARIILKDRLNGMQMIGLCGAILGVLGIISRGDPAILATLSFNNGDLIMVFCNLGLAGYAVLLKRLPPIQPLAFLFAKCGAGDGQVHPTDIVGHRRSCLRRGLPLDRRDPELELRDLEAWAVDVGDLFLSDAGDHRGPRICLPRRDGGLVPLCRRRGDHRQRLARRAWRPAALTPNPVRPYHGGGVETEGLLR